MSIFVRTTLALAMICCLLPEVVAAKQMRQPASILPRVRKKIAAKQEIIAPQAEEIPSWLLQAKQLPARNTLSAKHVASKPLHSKSKMPQVETKDFDVLGDIELSTPKSDGVKPTRKYRPQISPSVKPIEGPELRIPNVRRAKTTRSARIIR